MSVGHTWWEVFAAPVEIGDGTSGDATGLLWPARSRHNRSTRPRFVRCGHRHESAAEATKCTWNHPEADGLVCQVTITGKAL
jgi:hypothetical protein